MTAVLNATNDQLQSTIGELNTVVEGNESMNENLQADLQQVNSKLVEANNEAIKAVQNMGLGGGRRRHRTRRHRRQRQSRRRQSRRQKSRRRR